MTTKILDLQYKLFQWILHIGSANWRQINSVCHRLIEMPEVNINEKYPIYDLLYPLLHIGLIDVSYINNHAHTFSIAPACNIPYKDKIITRINDSDFRYVISNNSNFTRNDCIQPLRFLKQFPSLFSVILNFQTAGDDIPQIPYMFNFNDYEYIYHNKNDKTGLYKFDNKVYEQAYIIDKENDVFKIIPRYEVNFEAISWARCYVRVRNGESLFKYDIARNEICIKYYIEMPTLILRCLILCSPEQLLNETYYKRLNKATPLKNITKEIVTEIKKIFGVTSVEELHG